MKEPRWRTRRREEQARQAARVLPDWLRLGVRVQLVDAPCSRSIGNAPLYVYAYRRESGIVEVDIGDGDWLPVTAVQPWKE